MKKILLTLVVAASMSVTVKAQQVYSMLDSAVSYFRTPSWGQTSGAEASQAILFDDVNIPKASLAGYDSLDIKKIQFRIARYANAPATTMNIWVARVDPAATSYANIAFLPPKKVASFSLSAQSSTAQAYIVSLGDSINPLFKVKIDTGVYYNNYASFLIGISYADTTGNAWSLGAVTGNTYVNDNVFFLYKPATSTTTLTASWFGGYPRAQFGFRIYGSGSMAGTLPVSISSFTGERRNTVNVLNWSTATEVNNKAFQLQRSADGKDFSTIATIASLAENGNSSTALNYAYTDEKALKGNNYYRLIQVDKDGKTATSSVVLIKGQKTDKLEISTIYPNPVTTKLNMQVAAEKAGAVNFVITDINGKVVLQQNIQVQEGNNNIQIGVANLINGNYFIKAVCAEGCETAVKKFSKQ